MVVEKVEALPDISMRIMLSILAEEGLDTQLPLEAAGLPLGLDQVPGTVTAAQEFAFQEAFVRLTGFRPDLWVRTGGAYHLPSYGTLGFALITSSNLDESLKTSIDCRALDYSLTDLRPRDGANLRTSGYTLDVSEVPDAVREFTLYRDFGAIVTALRDLWGSRFPLRPIQSTLRPPTNGDFTILGEEVSFGAEQNSITWDKRYNMCPLRYGDPVLHAAYLESCRRKGTLRDIKGDFIVILEGFIRQRAGAQLSLAMLAAELGTTERTLQRRLRARDMSFRDLVDEARRRAATEMLTTSDTPIAEIAFRLGYSDAISFSQAFRRWTGVTPAHVRRITTKFQA